MVQLFTSKHKQKQKCQTWYLHPSLKLAVSSIGMMRSGKIPLRPTSTDARAAKNQGCSSNSSINSTKYSEKYTAKAEIDTVSIVNNFIYVFLKLESPTNYLVLKQLFYRSDTTRLISTELIFRLVWSIPSDELIQ